jgi:hypothetical protein
VNNLLKVKPKPPAEHLRHRPVLLFTRLKQHRTGISKALHPATHPDRKSIYHLYPLYKQDPF